MPRHVPALLALLATLAGPAAPAAAQAVDPDVRCLMLSNFFTNAEKDPARKQMALASATFFLGRIDARLSPAQLKAQIVGMGKAINKDNAGPLMTACARQLAAKQRSMVAISQSLAAAQPKKPVTPGR